MGYQADFFRTELSRMLDRKHPMVKVPLAWIARHLKQPCKKQGIRN
jgi:hypothetical protein